MSQLPLVLSAMRVFADDSDVALESMRCLHNLTDHPVNPTTIVPHTDTLCGILLAHPSHSRVLQSGIRTVWNMAMVLVPFDRRLLAVLPVIRRVLQSVEVGGGDVGDDSGGEEDLTEEAGMALAALRALGCVSALAACAIRLPDFEAGCLDELASLAHDVQRVIADRQCPSNRLASALMCLSDLAPIMDAPDGALLTILATAEARAEELGWAELSAIATAETSLTQRQVSPTYLPPYQAPKCRQSRSTVASTCQSRMFG